MKHLGNNTTVLRICLVLSIAVFCSCGVKSEKASLRTSLPQGAVDIAAVPVGLTATPGSGQVTLTWTASTGATTYNLYVSTAGAPTAASTLISDVSPGYVHNGLTNGTTYFYAVTAVNAGGMSALSNPVSATPVDIPASPTDLTAVVSSGQVTLTWSLSPGASAYNLYVSTDGAPTLASTKLANAASGYVHDGLTNDVTYYYAVTAINDGGESALSVPVSATPVATPTAPTNLAAVAGADQFTLTWDPVPGAASYNLYFGTAGSQVTKVNGVSSGYTRDGLTSGTTYYVSVSAVNASGEATSQSLAVSTIQ